MSLHIIFEVNQGATVSEVEEKLKERVEFGRLARKFTNIFTEKEN